jgi:hypothetical protein
VQTLAMHTCVLRHPVEQVPQWSWSLVMSISQPFDAFRSQSAKPVLQK